MNSWTVLEKLSSKVVYDVQSKEYIGVFAHKWIRRWSPECTDINKIKKIKVLHRIQFLQLKRIVNLFRFSIYFSYQNR